MKVVGTRKMKLGFLGASVALVALSANSSIARQMGAPNSASLAGRQDVISPTVTLPSQPWAQAASDLPADPDVRFGTLPNGVRYAILHNATPPKQASLWLRIDAGSLMEKDDQLGLAHFMEHMAFNGTTHIPKNDVITILERLGLQFGADLNAATSFDQTFYRLDMPRSDEASLDTGLHVLREQVAVLIRLAIGGPQLQIAARAAVERAQRPQLDMGADRIRVLIGKHGLVDVDLVDDRGGENIELGAAIVARGIPDDVSIDVHRIVAGVETAHRDRAGLRTAEAAIRAQPDASIWKLSGGDRYSLRFGERCVSYMFWGYSDFCARYCG